MQVDSSSALNGAAVESQASGSLVLKVIKKLDVQILCTQHNPVRKEYVSVISGINTEIVAS